MTQSFTKDYPQPAAGSTEIHKELTQTALSGSNYTFTGIPSGIKVFYLCFKEVDLSSTEHIEIQLGTSGGLVSSGYLGSTTRSGTGVASEKNTGGIEVFVAGANENANGVLTFVLMDEATHTWVCSGTVGSSDVTSITMHQGFSVALGGELTQLDIASESVNTFTDGEVNIVYENPNLAAANLIYLSGGVVQTVHTQDGETATGTTQIPSDDTIPQITEGTEFLTASITPTSSTNKLKIEVEIALRHSVSAASKTAALFQDSTADALAAAYDISSNIWETRIRFTHWMTAGTTNSTTFSVRAGASTAGTIRMNGATARRYGGVNTSSITITEYAV